MLSSFVEQTSLQKELVYTLMHIVFYQHTQNALSNRRDTINSLSPKDDTTSVNYKISRCFSFKVIHWML